MITCYLQGGLGNQLFILFTTMAYAIQNKTPLLFFYSEKLTNGCTLRYTYWNTLFKSLLDLTTREPILNNIKTIKEKTEGKYTKLESLNEFDQDNKSAVLYGYFQSYYYFIDEYPEISRSIGLPDMRYKYLQLFTENGLDPRNTISLHFRLGDYKKLKCTILPIEYYINSLRHILTQKQSQDITILYFCEKEDIKEVNEKIKVLQTHYPLCKYKCIIDCNQYTKPQKQQQQQEEDEMIIMSNCKYNIIANSTFSWWAAYIGYREDLEQHIICYPYTSSNPDLYPESWKSIEY